MLVAGHPISYLMSKQGFGGKRNSQAFKELYMKFQHVDMAKTIPLGMWIIVIYILQPTISIVPTPRDTRLTQRAQEWRSCRCSSQASGVVMSVGRRSMCWTAGRHGSPASDVARRSTATTHAVSREYGDQPPCSRVSKVPVGRRIVRIFIRLFICYFNKHNSLDNKR